MVFYIKYFRSEFALCKEVFLNADQVPSTKIPLRTAATKASTGTGQGFVKCSCKKSCDSNRCLCKKKEYCATLSAIIAYLVKINNVVGFRAVRLILIKIDH